MSITTPSSPLADDLASRIRACTLCRDLPLGPRPIVQLDPAARILIVGQAPGRKAHAAGIPFDDVSGDRLRHWLGVERASFYDPRLFALLPMGFCYPGTGKGGDLPPRPQCAPAWRQPALAMLTRIELTLVLGQFAVDWHLRERQGKTLTATVTNWRSFWPAFLPLPHPSPRNQRWFKQNPFFEAEILPVLRANVQRILQR